MRLTPRETGPPYNSSLLHLRLGLRLRLPLHLRLDLGLRLPLYLRLRLHLRLCLPLLPRLLLRLYLRLRIWAVLPLSELKSIL